MASLFRPAVLRQTCTTVSRRTFSTQLTTFPSNKQAASIVSRQLALSPLSKNAGTIRVAAFHATGKQAILPALPQSINGTANEPAPTPNTDSTHGSYHWTFERLISAGLVPLTIAPFAAGSLNPMMDALLCGLVVIHSHIGFDSCVTDYFPKWRVPKTRKFMEWVLKGCTVLVGVGLYEFETNDVGVTEAIKRVWTA